MSDCKVYRSEIVEAFDGGAMSRGARAHAEACRTCGDDLRGRESLRALVRGLGKVEAPSDFEFRLRARMAAAGPAGRRAPLRGLRLVYAFAPVAAAACFLVVSASLYFRQAWRPNTAETPAVVASAPVQSAAPAESAPTSASGGVKESKQTDVRPEVASVPTILPARPPIRVTRATSRPPREVAAKSDGRAGLQRNTLVASLSSARVISGRGVPFPLKTTAGPLRMILRDESGAGRVVSMRAVSFGSQELLARENVSRQSAAAENEGVW